MEKGFVQAKSIEKKNTESPKNSLVVMTVTGKDKIEIIEKEAYYCNRNASDANSPC